MRPAEVELIEQRSPRAPRLACQVLSEEAKDIEDDIGHGPGPGQPFGLSPLLNVHALGECREARPALVEGDHLTVEEQIVIRPGKASQLGEARGDVIAIA
ncbi:hypothetical protein GCM10009811_02570 [Nostocoides veronense]|uniref:Uncharacterized protein n=1 Tax=Nostocoides veronense TaxID=330836 RepID=A0ABN2LC84_9MICO